MFEAGKPIEIREMFDLREKNYDWESFKLENPKKYSSSTPTSQVPSGALFGNKNNYLDSLQKEKKLIPGPTDYKETSVKQRPKSGKMDKAERLTFSEEVKAKCNKQNLPGPGAYFKRPKSAASSSATSVREFHPRKHYLNDVQFQAISCPGVGQYNLTQLKHVGVPKIMKRASKSRKADKLQKQNKKGDIRPMEYFPGTFALLQNRPKKKDSNFFGSSKRFLTCSKHEKKPAPNSYKMNQAWNDKANVMKVTCNTMGSTPKSIYYH